MESRKQANESSTSKTAEYQQSYNRLVNHFAREQAQKKKVYAGSGKEHSPDSSHGRFLAIFPVNAEFGNLSSNHSKNHNRNICPGKKNRNGGWTTLHVVLTEQYLGRTPWIGNSRGFPSNKFGCTLWWPHRPSGAQRCRRVGPKTAGSREP